MQDLNMKRGVLGISLVIGILLSLNPVASSSRKLTATQPQTFLQDLPLTIVVTTPQELGAGGSVFVQDRQAITVVFSRPVIALGSDFNSQTQSKVPFTLTCGVPGKFRWVTTTIARFDPDIDWPSDLSCQLRWNTELTTYDGAVLQLGSLAASRTLSSPALWVNLDSVESKIAVNVTDGRWSAYTGAPGDKLPEVPPDGELHLTFSSPVNLKLLAAALKVLEGRSSDRTLKDGPSLSFTLKRCVSYFYFPLYQAAAPPPPATLDVNDTCVVVEVGAALKLDTWYTLCLPKGAKYFPLSGPGKTDLEVVFAGLRPFRLPFMHAVPANESEAYTSVVSSYRRFDLWLPHGLSRGITAADLSRNVRVCRLAPLPSSPPPLPNGSPPARSPSPRSPGPRVCTNVDFNLTIKDAATARIAVPSVLPGVSYRVYVSADATVTDGFGLPLQAAAGDFEMSHVPYAFSGPNLISGSFAVLEAGADNLTAWPYITRAPPPRDYIGIWPSRPYTRNITSYTIAPADDRSVGNLLTFIKGYFRSVSMLGRPATTVAVPARLTTPGSGAEWEQVQLPLGGAKLQVAYACCTPYFDNYEGDAISQLVLRSSLSVNVLASGPQLVAWVTDASQGGGVGVANANVSFFALPYYDKTAPYLVASCKTDASGLCNVTAKREAVDAKIVTLAKAPAATGGSRAETGPRYGLILNTGSLTDVVTAPDYVATVVKDRTLVVPGDSLKVTGFVQLANRTGLSLPPTSYVVLEVSPDWNGQYYGQNPQVVAEVNGTTGTFHAEIPVPASARLQHFTVQVKAGPKPALSAPRLPVDTRKWQPIASTYFIAGDPRPPTAELTVDAPSYVLTNGTITITATAVSYLGASVADSPVTFAYGLASERFSVQVSTDLSGVATYSMDLSKLTPKQVEELYGMLSFDVSWVGPTRDVISKTVFVRVVDGPATVTLITSLFSNLPGVSFAVAAAVVSSADGSQLKGIPVSVAIKPDPTANATDAPSPACLAAANLVSCTTISGGNWWDPATALSPGPCRMTLPCIGRFLLEGCAELPASSAPGADSVRVCYNTSMGLPAKSWAQQPLSRHDNPSMSTDKPDGYQLGETPTLAFENPFAGARLLLVWGNDNKLKTKVVSSVPSGTVVRVPLDPLGPECASGSCFVRGILDVPRVSAAAGLPAQVPAPGVPVSRLFDPRAPHTKLLFAELTVLPTNGLTVGVEVKGVQGGATVKDASGATLVAIEPGAKAEITAAVGAVAGDGPVEVTFYAVDKAFLDLMPYYLPKPQQEMLLRIFSWAAVYSQGEYRIAPGSVSTVFQKLLARLTKLDPWIQLDTTVSTVSYGRSAVDIPDDEYLAGFFSSITYQPGYLYPWDDPQTNRPNDGTDMNMAPMMPAQASSPPPPSSGGSGAPDKGSDEDYDEGGGSGSGSSSSSAPIRRVDDFVVTPLAVSVMVGPDGKARVNFTAPQNLGAFVIRAYAAAGSRAKYGSAEGKLVVRRSLSLTPSVPRFVREGDTFEAGVVVTVGSAPASVSVSVQLLNGSTSALQLTGTVIKRYDFAEGEDLQQEIHFSFKAVRIGTAHILINARDVAPGGSADALEVEVPVLGKQGDVWVATSFALAANASSGSGGQQWQEGLVLPDATPGSGGLTLTAGVGYYPAVCSVYDNLLEVEKNRIDSYAYAPTAILWATLPPVQSYYGQFVSTAQARNVTQSYKDLATLTDDTYGLLWTDPARWSSWQPQRTDIWLNAWALHLVGSHAAVLNPGGRAPGPLPAAVTPFAASWRELVDKRAPIWVKAVAGQLVADATDARLTYNTSYSDFGTLAWVRLALGIKWEPPARTPSKVKFDLSLSRTCAGVRKGPLQSRVILSLALQAGGSANPDPALVAATVRELTSGLRVQGRTAYIADAPGSPTAAPLGDQALGLLLLLRSGATHQLIPKLATYVANPTAVSGGLLYRVAPYTDQALAVLALSEYDRSRGSSRPFLDLEADANGVTVLKASFRVNKTAPVSNTTAWENIPPLFGGTGGSLRFQATGTGEVSVAASLRFVPATLATFPTYRGIYVESILQAVDPATGQAAGAHLASVPLGSMVSYTVQLTTPDDLGAVTLSVMMPGGLEPLDPNFAQDAGYNCDLRRYFDNYYLFISSRWGWYWPLCPAQETRPSVVTYNYAALRAGTVSVEIKAIAATRGSFLVPAVRAWVDQQPELMGMTAPGRLEVCADCTAPTYAPPPPTPKSCPRDCSSKGVCNLLTGTCVCDAGYSGVDCRMAAA